MAAPMAAGAATGPVVASPAAAAPPNAALRAGAAESAAAAASSGKQPAAAAVASTSKPAERDMLEKTVAFLQKREGIDKALKIIRYTSRLIAALSPEGSEARRRFDLLQSNVGNSRKAYRLGKFLQNVHGFRRSALWRGGGGGGGSRVDTALAVLEGVTFVGEGVYYFLDQFIWLMKAGVISKAAEKRLAKISAYAEAAGYAANICLNLHRIRCLQLQELALRVRLHELRAAAARRQQQQQQHQHQHQHQQQQQAQKQQQDGQGQQPCPCAAAAAAATPAEAAAEAEASELERRVAALRSARALRAAFVVQDLADALLALADITDGRYERMSHPVVLAVAGLVSAAVSSYKNWTAL